MRKPLSLLALGVLLFCAVAASAQDFGSFASGMPRMMSACAKLFADTPEFSAQANIGIFNGSNQMQMRIPMGFALTTNRMREEIDVTGMAVPAAAREAMQLAHLDKIVILTQADTKKVYVIFPGVQAYQEFPVADAVLEEMMVRTGSVDIKREQRGRQTVENHPCVNEVLTVTEPNRPPELASMVCATDMQHFPLRMTLFQGNATLRFAFEEVHIGRPDAALFELPADYREFASSADIMRYARAKFLSGSAGAPQ